MTRLPRLKRDQLDDAQRELFDTFVNGEKPGQRPRHPRLGDDGALEGPFNARLFNASIGAAMQQLGSAVRYGSSLTDRARELVILAVAQEQACVYERYAHEDIGRAVGLSDQEIQELRHGRTPDSVDDYERVVLDSAWALLREGDLDDAAYAKARAVLDDRGMFELLALIGVYVSTALQLRVFRVTPPD
jgi:4-carboxymuconolactone decarboxylase